MISNHEITCTLTINNIILSSQFFVGIKKRKKKRKEQQFDFIMKVKFMNKSFSFQTIIELF